MNNGMKEFRVSASGIVIDQDKILLVRCTDPNGVTFLLGPGGGVLPEEDLYTGLKREVFEETGLHVNPSKMLFVEDLNSIKYRVIKIWFLCSIIGGTLSETEEAKIEGIIEAGWYSKDQLKNEIVYPEILKDIDWKDLYKSSFETMYFPHKKARF